MTDSDVVKSDHEEIFLQPECCTDPNVGRLWCEHDSPEECDNNVPWTRYVRADRYEELEDAIHRMRALEDSYEPEDQVISEIFLTLNKLCGN